MAEANGTNLADKFDCSQCPITVAELKAESDEFEDSVLTRVERCKDGWSLTWGVQGFGLADDRNPKNMVPAVGDKIRVYGRLGRPVFGIDLNGEEVYWLTPLERAADEAKLQAQIDREQRENYDRAANDAAIADLPDPLRARMERFRREGGNGFWRSESYELFVCTEAAWLLSWVKANQKGADPERAIENFRALPPAEQLAAGMSDQHSGNTYGGMCALARAVLLGLRV